MFYPVYKKQKILPTVSGESKNDKIPPTVSEKFFKSLKSENFSTIQAELPKIFPLPWSAYVRLLSVEDKSARKFYEEEA